MTTPPRRLAIVGLGNYTHPLTKHSVGQVLLKNLALKAASTPNSTGSPHLSLSRSSAWTTTITLAPTRPDHEPLQLLFVLPKALMNVSGKPIVQHTQPFVPPASSPTAILKLLVLSDDLDLAPGRARTQRAGGPRGHNGVRSLVNALGGSRDFHRFWVGIGRPPGSEHRERGHGVARWVLEPLTRQEVDAVEWDQDEQRGGKVLEQAWAEVLRIGYEEE